MLSDLDNDQLRQSLVRGQSGRRWSTRARTRRNWAATSSIAENIGCAAETPRSWVRQAERDTGRRPGLSTVERQRLKALERENRELGERMRFLRKASAYFAQAELDPRAK